MSNTPKLRGKRIQAALAALAAALAVCVGLVLGACSAAGQDDKQPFSPDVSVLDASSIYEPGESMSIDGIVDDGSAQSSGKELFVAFPSLARSASLPDGVALTDFRGGAFDDASANAMEDMAGFAPNEDGTLPAGYSYVSVTLAVTNTADVPVSFDASKLSFKLINAEGSPENVGPVEPLWHDAWDGADPKRYWIVPIDAGQTLDITLLYALPDAAIDADNLVYLVDRGNASGQDGFVGMKAFDVAGQIEG